MAVLLAFVLAGCASQPVYMTLPDRRALNLPYSDAVRLGDTLWLSGAIGQIPGTRELVPGGITAETRQTLENIKRNLEAHGSSMNQVVKCTVMLADIKDFDAMNAVYREFFPAPNKPVRSTFGVNGLVLNARIEIECIAAAR